MKKLLLTCFAIAFSASASAADFSDKYLEAKEALKAKTNIDVGMSVSFIGQRMAPDGKNTSVQSYYYPYLKYKPFTDTAFGSGQFAFTYEYIHYFGDDALTIRERSGAVTDINFYPDNFRAFDNFKYIHTMPGDMSWLSVVVGAYSLYSIDGTAYTNDIQTGLINMSLSQSGTAAYSSKPGIMLNAQLGRGWNIMGGYADAQSTFGRDINFSTMFGGRYLTFTALEYRPTIENIGDGHYNVLGYHIDTVEGVRETTTGWSFNALQNFKEKYAVYARANGTNGEVSYTGINRSYALGFAYIDPFERNPNDVILLAGAFNQLPDTAPHKSETVLELAWVFGITKMFTITPDFQLYPNNGIGDNRMWKAAFGLRATIFL